MHESESGGTEAIEASAAVPQMENLTPTGPSESVVTLDRVPRLEDHVTLGELGRIDEAF